MADGPAPIVTPPSSPSQAAPEGPTAETAALLDILRRDSAVANAFICTEAYCRENGVEESWHRVEGDVLGKLKRYGVREIRYRGRRKLDELVRLANDFKRVVYTAMNDPANAAGTVADLAVLCNLPLSFLKCLPSQR